MPRTRNWLDNTGAYILWVKKANAAMQDQRIQKISGILCGAYYFLEFKNILVFK